MLLLMIRSSEFGMPKFLSSRNFGMSNPKFRNVKPEISCMSCTSSDPRQNMTTGTQPPRPPRPQVDVFMTDNDVENIVQEDPNRTHLDLTGCTGITYLTLGLLEKLDSLETLNISYCDLDDSDLEAGRKTFQAIKGLDISGCTRFGDDGLKALVQMCNALEDLDVGYCHFTDTGLHSVAHNCSRLKTIDLTCCTGVTNAVLASLVRECPYLEKIFVGGCHEIRNPVQFKAVQ